jgi:TatD DNase family protein
MQLTDTHCHLDFDRFDKDREKVVYRAVEAGLVRMLVPGIDVSSSQAAIRLADKYSQVYAAIGVHPNSGGTWESGTLQKLRALSKHPKVVAIGEIGLDYYRQWTPHNIQKEIFTLQLELANEVGLPVILHCREAYRDIQTVLTDWIIRISWSKLSSTPGVFHSFSGNIEQAKLLLEKQFYFGISGPVTYKNAESLKQTVAEIPLDRLLIETDAPYLTPHPRRGKRNEPAYVYYVAEKIAEIYDLSPSEIGEITSKNSMKLFNW